MKKENNWRVRILESGLDSCGVCDKNTTSAALSILTSEGFTLFQRIMILKEREICDMKEISGMDEKQTKTAINDIIKNRYIIFNKENNFYEFLGGRQFSKNSEERQEIAIDEIIFNSNNVRWDSKIVNPLFSETWDKRYNDWFFETPFFIRNGRVDIDVTTVSPDEDTSPCLFSVIGNNLTKEIMISYFCYFVPATSRIKLITPDNKTYNYFARMLNLL